MLKVTIPESKAKIQRQIEALEYALSQDSRQKDKDIHTEALQALREALDALETVENTPSNAGRPKKVKKDLIQELKAKGRTQEQIAQELKVSVATVRRSWK